MSRRRNGHGRSKNQGGQYFALPYSVARSLAWRSLSGAAVKVFLELRCRFTIRGDGIANNNGELALSLDEGARLLGLGKTTVSRALEELERAGFIAKVKAGHWYGRKATEYRVTDQSWRGEPPTRDWQRSDRCSAAEPIAKLPGGEWKPEKQNWELASDANPAKKRARS